MKELSRFAHWTQNILDTLGIPSFLFEKWIGLLTFIWFFRNILLECKSIFTFEVLKLSFLWHCTTYTFIFWQLIIQRRWGILWKNRYDSTWQFQSKRRKVLTFCWRQKRSGLVLFFTSSGIGMCLFCLHEMFRWRFLLNLKNQSGTLQE